MSASTCTATPLREAIWPASASSPSDTSTAACAKARSRRPIGQQRGGSHVQGALLPELQCAGGIAQGATHPEVVAHLRTIATQRLASAHLPHRCDRQRQRAARGVSPDQRDVVLVGQCEETIGKGFDPVFGRFRQRQCQRAPGRARAHRGQVGQIDRQRLPADVERGGLHREVHAAVERIGSDRRLVIGTRLQQRGVVTDAEQDVVALQVRGGR
ncbi:hypothetical protein G6F57_018718 [Rhizopus arrhizus]|nr:hypothetical protein G6F57_018718 [Rhizopus arrhizus]